MHMQLRRLQLVSFYVAEYLDSTSRSEHVEHRIEARVALCSHAKNIVQQTWHPNGGIEQFEVFDRSHTRRVTLRPHSQTHLGQPVSGPVREELASLPILKVHGLDEAFQATIQPHHKM